MAEENDLREQMRSMPVVFELPGMDQVEVRADLVYKTSEGKPLYANVYAPPAGERGAARLLPAVVFVGREITQYDCWGRLVAGCDWHTVTSHYWICGKRRNMR